MELEQDLRVTSDEMLRMLERLRELEGRKRRVQPGTDRFKELAEEVEALAAELFEHSRDQDRLAAESRDVRKHAPGVPRAIDDIPPTRELHMILAEWRDAERKLGLSDPGSDEATRIQSDVNRLRQEYRRAAEIAWREDRSG